MGAILRAQRLIAPLREKFMLPSWLCLSSQSCSSCCVATPMPEKSAAGARSAWAPLAGTGLLSLESLDDGALPRGGGVGALSLFLLIAPVS